MSSNADSKVSPEPLTSGRYESRPDLFDDLASPALRAAARQAASAGKAGDADLTLELRAVARCLESDDPEVLLTLQHFDPASCLESLDRLRGELSRFWSGGEQSHAVSADIATQIEALDRVQKALLEARSGPAEPPPSRGMNLAVEIAHDLRSPLTSILFLSETLRRGQSGEVTDLQHRQLGLIYAAALSMVSLASNLIELAQGEERLLEQFPAPFSVTESLESICDIVRPIAEEKKLALRVLPPSVDHRIGFSAALSRVLLNLLTNALQNTEDGFVEIAVRPKSVSQLEFSVRDTGSGLSEDARQSLFTPFRKVRKGSRFGFSGSGLGLAICRRLLKAMNSELHYETAAGWGTRFYFELELPPAGI
ncbi:MAG: sensor histidine kinase [Pseudomonas sp.]